MLMNDLPLPCSGIRRAALDVVECVLRGGVVPPFQALPHLLQLATDPEPGIAARALEQLQRQMKTAGVFVANSLPQGLEKAFEFHMRLASVQPVTAADRRDSLDPSSATSGEGAGVSCRTCPPFIWTCRRWLALHAANAWVLERFGPKWIVRF